MLSKEDPMASGKKNNEQKIHDKTLSSTTYFIHHLNHRIMKYNKWN